MKDITDINTVSLLMLNRNLHVCVSVDLGHPFCFLRKLQLALSFLGFFIVTYVWFLTFSIGDPIKRKCSDLSSCSFQHVFLASSWFTLLEFSWVCFLNSCSIIFFPEVQFELFCSCLSEGFQLRVYSPALHPYTQLGRGTFFVSLRAMPGY